ncbi:MAG: glycine cleavage T C-terminal barrel domain-containing protein [Pseudomonadota bacterium]
MDPSATAARLPFQARIRKSAFFNAARRHGCHSFGVYNRTYIAMGFLDPVTEYQNLLDGVVLWPAMGERQLEITGPDASRFVQLLTPRNLSAQAVGQCKYALITNARGGIVNDPICLKLAEQHYWLSAADSDIWLYAQGINAVRQMDVELRDPDVAVLQIQGPRSLELMTALFGNDVGALRYYWHANFELAGYPVVVSRTGWSNEWGYEIYLRDPAGGDAVFDLIVERGKAFELTLGVVSQIRRIEGGMLSYGADMDMRHNPFELRLGRLVELEQPLDYIGRAALAALAGQPPAQLICGLSFAGPALAGFIEPWPLQHEGETVSHVTSLAWSPRLMRNIGLAILPSRCCDPGQPMTMVTPDGNVDGVVSRLPFMERRTTRT